MTKATGEYKSEYSQYIEQKMHISFVKLKSDQRDDESVISKTDLVEYFDYTEQEAARKLGISVTKLKHIARHFKIPRWPHRRVCHKKFH